MKTLFTLTCLLMSVITFAQKEQVTLKEMEYNDSVEVKESKPSSQATGLSVSTDDLKELRNLDWDLMLSAFESNDPDQEIEVSVEFKEKGTKSKTKTSKAISVAVTGKTAELDTLKKRLQKLTAKMVVSVEKWNK
ncbi:MULTISPECIES: hypothetical protein [unclassified Leeuwenhoekiella]|uniref:hypothetical protein n=1 Tax=unclassified Leeuwenhoekiella TaxID=2615029 RepID=UPI000C36B235|nr:MULTISPECIES: hypothetical protein [unclassified Leeuwenhoekiella]MBA82533.1 hypothetical protein [Leeuwenhoekiella sp.]